MKNEKYEKKITLISLFQSLKRNLMSIVTFTVFFALLGFTCFKVASPQKYQTTGQLNNKFSITTTVLNTLRDTLKSDLILYRVEEQLESDGIKHKDGSVITQKELSSGLIIPSSNNSFYISISLRGTDKTTLKTSLETIFDVTINYFKTELKRGEFTELRVTKSASNPIDVSNIKLKTACFGFIGFLAAFAISYLFDYKRDLVAEVEDIKQVYDEKPLMKYVFKEGKIVFKKRKDICEDFQNVSKDEKWREFLVEIQNHINIYGDSKVIAICSSVNYRFSMLFANSLAKEYISEGSSVLLVDTNMYNPCLNNIYMHKEGDLDSSVANIQNGDIGQRIHKESDKLFILSSKEEKLPSSVLKSENFQTFLDEAKTKYDHIILVLPPVYEHQDILLLKQHITSCLIMVQKNKISKQQLFDSTKTLEKNDISCSGICYVE